MANRYATEEDRSVGSVYARKTSTVVIDIGITPGSVDYADEYVISVNGRPLRRLTKLQAARLGILTNDTEKEW